MFIWIVLIYMFGCDVVEVLVELGEDLIFEFVGSGVFEIEDGLDRWEVGLYFDEVFDEVVLVLIVMLQGVDFFVILELFEVDWVVYVKCELFLVEVGWFFVYGSYDVE